MAGRGRAEAPRRAAALVTRPREDAREITALLEARGLAVRLEPLLDIRTLRGVALPLDGLQGFVATSANGVRALSANLDDTAPARALPLWAVGDATARAARDLGFSRVASAGGDVEALAELIVADADPAEGPLLHAAGSKLAGDLAGRLAARGFELRRAVLYEACTATALSPATLAALDGEALDFALFFSPRTAQTFVTLAEAAGRAAACRRLVALALSPAVAAALAPLPWRRVAVAERPEQAALLATLDALLEEG